SVASALKVPPGFGNVTVGQTTQLAATIVDPIGNPVPGGSFTWVSRNTGIATVNSSGLVTGVANGTGTIVVSSSSFTDSILVTVTPAGNAVVNTVANVESYGSPKVGEDVQVQAWADLRYASGDKIASYNARLTWNVAQMTFVDTTASVTGDFPSPLVNKD